MAIDRKAQLAENLAAVKASIPNDVHLIVVTKTFPLSDAQLLHDLGVLEFGENRDQEGKETDQGARHGSSGRVRQGYPSR